MAEMVIIHALEHNSASACDMPLADIVGVKGTIIQVQNSHYYFMTLLLLKELLVYGNCVRRANMKLEREEQKMGKGAVLQEKIYPVAGIEDHFVKH